MLGGSGDLETRIMSKVTVLITNRTEVKVLITVLIKSHEFNLPVRHPTVRCAGGEHHAPVLPAGGAGVAWRKSFK